MYNVAQRKRIENRDINNSFFVDAENVDAPLSEKTDIEIPHESNEPKLSRKKKDLKARVSERDIKCAEYLLTKIRENKPDYRPNFSDSELLTWADEARLMFDRDQRSKETVLSVINWCQGDSFWKMQILSMSNLRSKFDRLEMEMKNHGKKSSYPVGSQTEVSGKLKEFIPEEHGIDFEIDYGKWMDKTNG